MPSSHHIVVVGGGVAGLAIASKLPTDCRPHPYTP